MNENNNINENQIKHADFGIRFKAAVFDESFLVLVFLLMIIFSSKYIGGYSLLLSLIFLFTFEPLITYFYGNTIAQYFIGLKIISDTKNGKLSLFRAFMRFYIKVILGMFSLIFMLFSNRKQSIHDKYAKTLVVLSNEKLLQKPSLIKYEIKEEIEDSDYYINPKPARKFIVFLIWYSILGILLLAPAYVIVEELCSCKTDLLDVIIQPLIFILLAYFAADGKLLGARKKKKLNED